MYNTEKLIAKGQEIMKQNPRKMLTAHQMVNQKEQSEDIYQFGSDMFLMGLAIGARIGEKKNSGLAEG